MSGIKHDSEKDAKLNHVVMKLHGKDAKLNHVVIMPHSGV